MSENKTIEQVKQALLNQAHEMAEKGAVLNAKTAVEALSILSGPQA